MLTIAAACAVPFGVPVRVTPEGCWPTGDLDDMVGVAARRGGSEGYAPGDLVFIQTDGGIRAQLVADVDVDVRGVPVRLTVFDAHYLHLAGGRVVGFLGDDRLGL